MKSIKQQYIDLCEGRMSQANFMRNLRMTMPQYITNVTSFNDSVKILKNKGILTEADEKGKWTNTSGKSMYDQFKEIDNLNGQEVLIGIDYEREKNPELTKVAAAKIVIKNLKKNSIYYTSALMADKEGYEPEYIGGKSANPEAHQMQYLDKNMGNVVDKKRGMQPVKDVEKFKKDSDTATAQKYKTSGIDLMSLVAKSTRGVKKMDATGEKMKKITMNEVRFNDFGDPNEVTLAAMEFIDKNPTLKSISDKLTIQNSYSDAILRYDYWEVLPANALAKLEMLFNVERMNDFDEDTGTIVAYRLTPKGIDENKVAKTIFDKNALAIKNTTKIGKGEEIEKRKLTKADLMKMIREELEEMFDGMEPMVRTGLDEVKVGDKLKHKLTGAEMEVTKVDGNDVTTKYTKLGGMEGKAKIGSINKTNKNLIGKTYELISELDEVDIYGIAGNPEEEKSRRDASIKKPKYEPINPALAKATEENEKLDMLLNQDIDVIVGRVERNPDLGLKLLGRARKTKPSFVSALKTALGYK
jgi:hypothetical protein